jgi:succinate dehydrogenase / fumarate reductase, flavoprotein subunit
VMMADVGVFREEPGMNRALECMRELKTRFQNDLSIDDRGHRFNTDVLEAWELNCLLDLAEVTTLSAINRTESRGGHSREDYRERDDANWLVHSLVYRKSTDLVSQDGLAELEINTEKKVDMSLAAEDPRFEPKVRAY